MPVELLTPAHADSALVIALHCSGAGAGEWRQLGENLGPDYVVWDKSASIRFRRPGKGRVSASFRLNQQQLDDIRQALTTQEKLEPTFTVEVKDDSGTVIAEVQKLIHIKKREGGS